MKSDKLGKALRFAFAVRKVLLNKFKWQHIVLKRQDYFQISNMYMSMTLNYKSAYPLFTFWLKTFLRLSSVLSWKRFRIQLEKRVKRVRIHFMMN